MAIAECPNNYCGINKSVIDGTCHELDYQPGNKLVIDRPPMPVCWCVCSCLSENTPISTPDGTIKVQDIKPGQTTVLAAGKDLKWNPVVVQQWSHAAPGKWVHVVYLKYQIDGADRELVVTRDQLFLLHDKRLKAADKLAISDKLTDRNGSQVIILEIGWGTYRGEFYELATVMEEPDKQLTNHLVLAAGVVTPDFAVQIYQDIGTSVVAKLLEPSQKEPSVGTPEWIKAHGDAMKRIAARSDDERPYTQADPHAIKVPDYASPFLPRWQASVLELVAPKKPFDDPIPRQMVEYLQARFACLYPDVDYHFNWYDFTVNSFSWVDTTSKRKNVYIAGGLSRIAGFDTDGVTLAFAHELGHLYGSDPGDDGVTCEGEADYFGSKIVLRKFWFFEEYVEGMHSAIAQFNTLVGYLGREKSPDGQLAEKFSSDQYPSIPCRRETFAAGLALGPIPECAACPK